MPGAVLITRPEPGAARTAARLAELGFAAISAPALVIRALPGRLPPPRQVQAVLATSANALPALGKAWHGHRLFAVGGATAARARAAGFTDARNADGDATALAALVARDCRPADGPVLLLSGQHQGIDLAGDLRRAGFRVLRRVVYAARPAPALPRAAVRALAAGQVGQALFFSAETAYAFLNLARRAGLLEHLRAIAAIAIGEPARVALHSVPWREIRVAARPTQDSMLACLI